MESFYLKIKDAQEAQQYAQILENAGFKWWDKGLGGRYTDGDVLFKCKGPNNGHSEAEEFFFVDYMGSQKPIFDSWADFLSFLIKQCYCEVTNSSDKTKILRLAFGAGLCE